MRKRSAEKCRSDSAIGEQNKSRRPDGGLRDVVDLNRRFDVQGLDETVQLSGCHSFRGGIEDGTDQREQLLRRPMPFAAERNATGA